MEGWGGDNRRLEKYPPSTILLRLLPFPVCCEAGGGLWITRCAEVNSFFLFFQIGNKLLL